MDDTMTTLAQPVIDLGNPPQAYGYDDDGIFTQAEICSPDPLESELTGKAVWMLPANATFMAPPSAESGTVAVWNGTAWELQEDNRGVKYWLPGDAWSSEPREMKDLGPLPDGAMLNRPEKTIDELKADKVIQIDSETSAAILAGFDYTIDGTSYHFSYDSFDQQNFSDTANMCQLALSGTPGLPTSVVWNSYLPDGTLVQQTFDAQSFLALYTAGAMQHKATQMTIGGQRKAKVWAAQTKEEIEAI